MPATHPFVPRVSVIFDFDRTLATDTVEALCCAWGISREEWEKRYLEPLGNGWDSIIQRCWALIECGRDLGQPLSRDLFDKAAGEIELYPDVTYLKQRLTRAAQEIEEGLEVELAVLSSGFIEIIERTPVAEVFDLVWAGSFHFDEDGCAQHVKRIIGHAEKALYIESYAKGLDLESASEPQTDSPDFDPQDMYVPFDQVIYVGDGVSDLQAFGFVAAHGGLALAVNKSATFEHVKEQTAGQRVENLAPPDYRPDAEMFRSLCHAVRSAASRAALRRLGEGQ